MSADGSFVKFVERVLAQASKDDATDVVIGAAGGDTTPVKYKVGGSWYDMAPPPARLRTDVIANLGRLASLPEGPFPKQGMIDITTESGHAKWDLKAPAEEGEWSLSRRA